MKKAYGICKSFKHVSYRLWKTVVSRMHYEIYSSYSWILQISVKGQKAGQKPHSKHNSSHQLCFILFYPGIPLLCCRRPLHPSSALAPSRQSVCDSSPQRRWPSPPSRTFSNWCVWSGSTIAPSSCSPWTGQRPSIQCDHLQSSFCAGFFSHVNLAGRSW